MDFRQKLAEEERITFINNCIDFDTPRLATEEYPEDVKVTDYGRFEVYTPSEIRKENEAFFLIHGGAFVYGQRNLDKAYGMELSKMAGVPVINADYTLMPKSDLKAMLTELSEVMNEATAELNIQKIHTTGDSAGGYLALIMALINRSDEMRIDLGVEVKTNGEVLSAGLICGCYSMNTYGFPGLYFKSESPYAYDLIDAVDKFGAPPCAIVTGDDDFLREDNRLLNKLFTEKGIPSYFMDAQSADGRNMHHVFPIAHPTWPEGIEALKLVVKAAGLEA